MIMGSGSMIVFRHVLRLDEATAREVKSWAVRAALEEGHAERVDGPPAYSAAAGVSIA